MVVALDRDRVAGDRPSFTAAWRSAAAFASTLCLFLEQSFAAFQKVSWSFGYFSRCSGLK